MKQVHFTLYIYMIEFKGQTLGNIAYYKSTQRAIRQMLDGSTRAGFGQWHEYDHVSCNKTVYVIVIIICE